MKNIRKKQGIFLSVMILFLIIGDLQIPYYLANPDALKTIYSSVPWLLIAYFASKVFVDFMYVLPEKQALVCMTTVVGAGFWFWAVRRKWNLFE
jgi:hypothetical protein